MLFFARFPRPSPVVVGLRLGAMARVLLARALLLFRTTLQETNGTCVFSIENREKGGGEKRAIVILRSRKN